LPIQTRLARGTRTFGHHDQAGVRLAKGKAGSTAGDPVGCKGAEGVVLRGCCCTAPQLLKESKSITCVGWRQVMPELEALEEAVEALDPSAWAEFRRWFAEFDAAAWDRQLEADLTAGKLDALLTEAEDDYPSQPRRPL
jgi:hypothetical protein